MELMLNSVYNTHICLENSSIGIDADTCGICSVFVLAMKVLPILLIPY